MDASILHKVILFWVIFYITPGPVWITVMEATRKLNFSNTSVFFLKVFFPVNISIQFSQALICVVFVDFVSKAFLHIDLLLYSLGGCYILFLAYKTLKSKKSNTLLELTFSNLAIVMLLSPKIWLLFPSGSVIANQLNQSVVINAFVFAFSMLAVSNLMFVLYVIIGKIGTKLLKDNFSYLTFSLLILFAYIIF